MFKLLMLLVKLLTLRQGGIQTQEGWVACLASLGLAAGEPGLGPGFSGRYHGSSRCAPRACLALGFKRGMWPIKPVPPKLCHA